MFQVPSISSMGSKIPPTGSCHLLHGEHVRESHAERGCKAPEGTRAPARWGFLKTLIHISRKQTAKTMAEAHQLCRSLGPYESAAASPPLPGHGKEDDGCFARAAWPVQDQRTANGRARLLREGVTPREDSLPPRLHSPSPERGGCCAPRALHRKTLANSHGQSSAARGPSKAGETARLRLRSTQALLLLKCFREQETMCALHGHMPGIK